ncbi:hypothetical protein J4K11_34890, partial [Burkholderia contaminans]|nr:hypothetical protein [Burkholderia contaminans]
KCSCQKRQKTATLKPFESAFYPRFCWRHYAAHPRLLYAAPRQLPRVPLTATAQIRMCGNSVSPVQAEALIRANFAHEKQLAYAAA